MLKRLNEDLKYPRLNLIVCTNKNGVIGDRNPEEGSNGLLWHSSEELQTFKKITNGHVLIFGTNTAKYVPIEKMKGTREIYIWDGKISLEELMEKYKGTGKDIFICGGAYTYEYFIKNYYIDSFFISVLKEHVEVKEPKEPLYFYLNDERIREITNEPDRISISHSFNDFNSLILMNKLSFKHHLLEGRIIDIY